MSRSADRRAGISALRTGAPLLQRRSRMTRAVFGSSTVIAALSLLGCSAALGPGDGGVDRPADAPPCGCHTEADGTLVMTLACYCEASGCSVAACNGTTAYQACGLTVSRQEGAAGPDIYVTNSSGALVGVQRTADIGIYHCPDDPGLSSGRVRAGLFPDPTCDAMSCKCAADGKSCVTVGDGGTSDGCDCRIQAGVMTMSWGCFCSGFGGCDQPLSCSSAQRLDYP